MLSRRNFLSAVAGVGVLAALPRRAAALDPRMPAASAAEPLWLAGDFHCHTFASHDVWQPSEGDPFDPGFWTYGHTAGEQIQLAELRGLDFLAVTDHNTLEGIRGADYRSDLLTLVPGYEHSIGGHAGIFLPTLDDFPAGDGTFDAATVPDLLAQVGERGGLTVFNHPFYSTGAEPKLPPDLARRFDAVEVWNSAWITREEITPVYEPDNYLAVAFYGEQLAPLGPLAAIGGSDNHWKVLDPVAGVGQPTTWVLSADRSVPALIAAVKAGRTSVAFQPPALGGGRLDVVVDEAWAGGTTALLGGAVREGGVHRVRATASGLAGQRLRVIAAGMVILDELVEQPEQTFAIETALITGEAVRAETYIDTFLAVTALTSAIRARPVDPEVEDAPPSHPGPVPRPSGPPVSYDGFFPAWTVDRTALDRVLLTLGDRSLPRCSCHAG